MKSKVCTSCGYIGKPIHDEWSSFVLDVFAWLLWFAIAAITAIFPLAILGPAFSVYHLMMFRTKKCPKCGNLDMVRLQSQSGKRILTPHEGGTQPWTDSGQYPIH